MPSGPSQAGRSQERNSRAGSLGWAAVALFALGLALEPAAAWAAPFNKGDQVQVFFLNKWWPGTVVDYERGRVMVEYEFAGRVQQKVFDRTEVRLAYEADAITKARFWTDASGQFRIRTAAIALDSEKVTLRKPDMSEIDVPISKLSESDQRFLARLQKEAGRGGGKGPSPPPVEQFTTARASGTSWAGGAEGRVALTPDPIPAHLRMQHGGVAFAKEDFFDKVDMPERILDPAKKNGIGTTRVTNRGLIPGPATPPRPPATPGAPGAPGAIPPGMVPTAR